MFLTIFTFIIVLSILVFVHELGHFWVAKKCGLTPEEFGFGYPPRAAGIYKSKEGKWKKFWGNKAVDDASGTVYSINWIPIGGFVKLGEDDEPGDNPNHFNNKPAWQRGLILIAGVLMNFILTITFISVGFMIGLPQALVDLPKSAVISNEQVQIVEVLEDSPAAQAEMKIGDVVLSINDTKIESVDQVEEIASSNEGKELVYKIKRGKDEMAKKITPEIIAETQRGGIGIGIIESGTVRYPFFIAIWEGIKSSFILAWTIIVAFYTLIKGLVTGAGLSAEIAGPVGIAVLTGQVAHMGLIYVLQFTAILSLNLAIINALPFPALDGGRLLFLLIEAIKGKPVKKEVEGTIHYIGFVLLMVLVAVVTFRDVAKYGGKFKIFFDHIVQLIT